MLQGPDLGLGGLQVPPEDPLFELLDILLKEAESLEHNEDIRDNKSHLIFDVEALRLVQEIDKGREELICAGKRGIEEVPVQLLLRLLGKLLVAEQLAEHGHQEDCLIVLDGEGDLHQDELLALIDRESIADEVVREEDLVLGEDLDQLRADRSAERKVHQQLHFQVLELGGL